MDQVDCFVLGEMFLQALFDILHTGSRAVRDDDDRAIARKVPENAEESFDTFTFVRNDESGVGEEVVQVSQFVGLQNVREPYGVDVHIPVPLCKWVSV